MSPRILLLDDAAEHREQLATALRHAGYQVDQTGDGREALAAMRRAMPAGLVVELLLPGVSGFAVIHEARRLAPVAQLPILALSDVFDSRRCREDAVARYGLLGVCSKPVRPDEVVELLRRRIPVQPELPRSQTVPEPPRSDPRPTSSSPELARDERTGPRRRPDAPSLPPLDENTQPNAVLPGAPSESGPRATEPPSPSPVRLAATRSDTDVPGLRAAPTQTVAEPPARAPILLRLPAELESGDLLHTAFPVLLCGLHRHRASGTLFLRQERKKKVIGFAQGVPRQIKSNLLQECLGRILLREGMINEAELEQSVNAMRTQKQLQGQILIRSRAISEKNLQFGLERQLETKLLEVFSWMYGAYRFQAPEERFENEVSLPWSIPELCREGMLQYYPAERATEELSRLAHQRLEPARDPARREQHMGLTPQEEAFFRRFDGVRSCEQLLAETTLPRNAAGRLLLGLLYAGKLELVR